MKLYKLYKPGCAPCALLDKELEEVQKEFPDLEIVKVNIVHDMSMVQEHGVKSVPFILLEKDGVVVGRSIGYKPASSINRLIRAVSDDERD